MRASVTTLVLQACMHVIGIYRVLCPVVHDRRIEVQKCHADAKMPIAIRKCQLSSVLLAKRGSLQDELGCSAGVTHI